MGFLLGNVRETFRFGNPAPGVVSKKSKAAPPKPRLRYDEDEQSDARRRSSLIFILGNVRDTFRLGTPTPGLVFKKSTHSPARPRHGPAIV